VPELQKLWHGGDDVHVCFAFVLAPLSIPSRLHQYHDALIQELLRIISIDFLKTALYKKESLSVSFIIH
jgi:hypothetical protein